MKKNLVPRAEAILNKYLHIEELNQLSEEFMKLIDKPDDIEIDLFAEKVLLLADKMVYSIWGKKIETSPQLNKVLTDIAVRVASASPEALRMTKLKDQKAMMRHLKKYYNRALQNIRQGKSEKKQDINKIASPDILLEFLQFTRNEWYRTMTSPNRIVKGKIDVIYEISEGAYSSLTAAENMDKVFGSELFAKIITIAQKQQKVLDAFKIIEKKGKQIDVTYLHKLMSAYKEMYDVSEIMIKILYCFVKVGEGGSPVPENVLNDKTGNCITFVNNRFPGLYEGDPVIRNALTHQHNAIIDFHNSKVEFTDNKKQKELAFTEFRDKAKGMADTLAALLQIPSIQLLILLDRVIKRIETETSATLSPL